MALIANFHQETGALPLAAHLNLACAQFFATGDAPGITSHSALLLLVLGTAMKAFIQSRIGHLVTPFLADGIMSAGAYGEAKRPLHREIATRVAVTGTINNILAAPPPPIASVEALLPCPYH
jgi:hypothetical protein